MNYYRVIYKDQNGNLQQTSWKQRTASIAIARQILCASRGRVFLEIADDMQGEKITPQEADALFGPPDIEF